MSIIYEQQRVADRNDISEQIIRTFLIDGNKLISQFLSHGLVIMNYLYEINSINDSGLAGYESTHVAISIVHLPNSGT